MKTIFDQITDKLRQRVKDGEEMMLHQAKLILKQQAEIDRLEEQNHRLRQELEHKAFQDDF